MSRTLVGDWFYFCSFDLYTVIPMKEETLQEIGLSQNETKVYLSLLDVGLVGATKIAHTSKVHRVNVYDALEKLKKKGLVSESIRDGKKLFQASDPSNLRNLLRIQEIKLDAVLPQLQMNYSLLQQEKYDVQIYEGSNAIRNIFLKYLEINKPIVTFGVPKGAIEKFGKFFQDEVHKRRAEQKQWMYHIYNVDAFERIKLLNSLPFTQARFLDKGITSPVATRVCGDTVSITFYYENPLTIVIKNKDMADSYYHYFWILWAAAKEV